MALVMDSTIVSGVRSLHSKYSIVPATTDGYLKPIVREFNICARALEFMFGSVIDDASHSPTHVFSRYDVVDDYKMVNQLVERMNSSGLPSGVVEPLESLSKVLLIRFEQAARTDIDFAQLRDWWSI